MKLRVKRFLTSVNASNCYICWCEGTKEGVIVDPSEFNEDMRAVIADQGIRIVGIFITHSHYDHDSALEDVRDVYKVPVYAINNYPGGEAFKAGDSVTIGGAEFRAEATPGHTDDSITFITDGVAFVGDALFAAAVGGTSHRDNFETETAGVRKHIFSLPNNTRLFPGHGPATTVSVERCYNPFFI